MSVGASTVKYTTSLPYIGLNESDSKLYNDFTFCEGKIINISKNTLLYKAKQFMLKICFSRKFYVF